MIITPNMSLTAWNSTEDDFDHTQLAQDFVLIDAHDHSAGKGKPINAASAIVANSITAALIASEAITQALLANDSVGAAQLINGAVGNSQLADNAVATANLQDNSVTIAQVAPGAGAMRISYVSASESYSANNGDLLIVENSASITMPPPTINTVVGFIGAPGLDYLFEVHPNGSESFYGPGYEGGVALGVYGRPLSVTYLQSDGTNWYSVNGGYDSDWIPFTDMGLLSGVVSEGSGFPASARLINDELHFRGSLVNVSGSTIVDTTTLFTLPPALRPQSTAYMTTFFGEEFVGPGGGVVVFFQTTGVVTAAFAATADEFPIDNFLYFDGRSIMIM